MRDAVDVERPCEELVQRFPARRLDPLRVLLAGEGLVQLLERLNQGPVPPAEEALDGDAEAEEVEEAVAKP